MQSEMTPELRAEIRRLELADKGLDCMCALPGCAACLADSQFTAIARNSIRPCLEALEAAERERKQAIWQRGDLRLGADHIRSLFGLQAFDWTGDSGAAFEEIEGRIATQIQRTVKVSIGTGSLTRDLVWCQCGRSLSLNRRWEFCPRCGGKIDQDSYTSAIDKARANGANLYRDVDYDLQLAAQSRVLEQAREALEAANRQLAVGRRFLPSHGSFGEEGIDNYKCGQSKVNAALAAIAALKEKP